MSSNLIIDEWSGLKSNLVKLGLGSVSMFFDILFMIQHYILYPSREEPVTEQPLIIEDIEKRDIGRSASGKFADLSLIKTP